MEQNSSYLPSKEELEAGAMSKLKSSISPLKFDDYQKASSFFISELTSLSETHSETFNIENIDEESKLIFRLSLESKKIFSIVIEAAFYEGAAFRVHLGGKECHYKIQDRTRNHGYELFCIDSHDIFGFAGIVIDDYLKLNLIYTIDNAINNWLHRSI